MGYDGFVHQVARDTLLSWKESWLAHKAEGATFNCKFEKDYTLDRPTHLKENPLEFDYEATLTITPTSDGVYKVDGVCDEGRKSGREAGPGWISVEFQIDPMDLPESWEEISMDLRDVIRHEIEHLLQCGWSVRKTKRRKDDSAERMLINMGVLPKYRYFLLKKEVDAMLYGMYLKAKKRRVPFAKVIQDYFNILKLSAEDQQRILETWCARARQLSLPNPSIYEAVK